jgi:RNA polymerase sigma factor (sigma-70 family)
MTAEASPTRNGPSVTELVIRAKYGDKQAWDALVERYAPLIWSICRRYRLGTADAEDVNQSVWLMLVDQISVLREPAALPGWLATTAQRECCRVLRTARRTQPGGQVLEDSIPDEHAVAAEEELLKAERQAALREAFTCLPPGCQRLLAMLIQDPPVPYAQISAELGIPVGSIGPTRRRCLEKLRSHPTIAALIDAETGNDTRSGPGDDGQNNVTAGRLSGD